MMCVKKYIALFFFLLAAGGSSLAQVGSDSVKIHFRQGYSRLDLNIGDNREVLERISENLRANYADTTYILKGIQIIGGASPEGSIPLNKRLSERRANVLFDYLSAAGHLPDSLKTFTYIGRDWKGLLDLVEKDGNVPYQEEAIAFLRDVVARCENGEREEDRNFARLVRLRDGEPYRYMYYNLFPELRASRLIVTYGKIQELVRIPGAEVEFRLPEPAAAFKTVIPPATYIPPKPFYMALKTDMLYDALLVPNAGVEFYLGGNFSVSVDWMYAWWKNDRSHWYWRTYGGEVAVRRWFGRKAQEKPLTGHHIGIYGQALTYDFETGGRGYMGGEPGGTLFDRCNYGVGVEYGYSLPIARRLNIDFTVGVGYFGGKYYEYLPMDDCYVWQATKNRRYFGPAKAEVSLVWLLGRGNVNKGKGGNR